jgi:arylsulfatase A-like enzyme
LKKLDDLGIADKTIVIYSTDNGPHYNAWLDAAVTPFSGEKNTKLGGRLQCAVLHPLDRQDSRRRDQSAAENRATA